MTGSGSFEADLLRPRWPFVRLFSTTRRAISFWPWVLATVAVIVLYAGGRAMDGIWRARGHGVVVASGLDEIRVYAGSDLAHFESWRRVMRDRGDQAGIFARLLEYESDCFAAAIQATLAGRWLFGPGALDEHPTLLGSLYSAARGFCWLTHTHPWYALIYGLLTLLIFSVFGAAICRYAAIQSARDENPQFSVLREFVYARWSEAFVAPIYPLAIFAVIFVVMVLASLVGAIPVVGPLLMGLGYFLALLGGVGLAFCLLATILGYPLMTPTLAVEHSDAFDAVQRSAGYVFQRPWFYAFYWFVLLLYGAGCFLVLRAILLLVFKLTHVATATGMSVFGLLSAGPDGQLDPLSALWHMPAWADLPLIPRPGGPPFWGQFAAAPLSGAGAVAMVLIAVWVFLGVSALAGYVVSFFFCGATEMYFLLRKAIDGIDYEEIYYEEPAEPLPAETAPPPTAEAPATGDDPGPGQPPDDTAGAGA